MDGGSSDGEVVPGGRRGLGRPGGSKRAQTRGRGWRGCCPSLPRRRLVDAVGGDRAAEGF
jgi:hypothetical protein